MTDEIPLMDAKKPTIGDFVRSGSCLGEPSANALQCLRDRNITLFLDLVNLDDSNDVGVTKKKHENQPLPPSHWINQCLDGTNGDTLLTLAIRENLPDFVDVLLQVGADASLYNEELEKSPLHLAAANCGAIKCLKLLFKYPGNSADVNALLKSGRSALHICVEKNFLEGLNFLLSRPSVLVDAMDKKGQQTPLFLAAKLGHREMVEILIMNGASADHVCFGKPISTLVQSKWPDLNVRNLPQIRAPLAKEDSPLPRLASLIESASLIQGEDAAKMDSYLYDFQQLVMECDRNDLETGMIHNETLLLKACHEELPRFVEVLLKDGGVNPNRNPSSMIHFGPVLASAKRGDFDSLKLLIEHGADLTVVSVESKHTVLHAILTQQDPQRLEGLHRCLNYLLVEDKDQSVVQQVKSVVNKKDSLRNTALHYASRLWPQSVVRALLELGANIGIKNRWDEVPITHIEPDTMEKFLDEFCLQSNVGNNLVDANHDNLKITFNYSFLAPPNEDLPENLRHPTAKIDPDECAERGRIRSSRSREKRWPEASPLPETESLWYLSQSKGHRHLLKHPVITSFLWLKWARIRRYYNRNLRFYLLFVYILTWYIFERFAGEDVRAPEGGSIPFLYGLYGAFTAMLIFFIVRDWKADMKDAVRTARVKCMQSSNDDHHQATSLTLSTVCSVLLSNWIEVCLVTFLVVLLLTGARLLWTALVILVILLAARELFQMTVSLKRYVFSPENWIELTTITLTMVILFHPDDGSGWSMDLKRHMAAILIVLSWAELITLVGKHPKLARYNVYVMMFYKVMGTFFFFLIWYAFFIVAYGLAFYILLHEDPKPKEEDQAVSSDKEEYIFFNYPWLSLVKTSAMFVGELEFSDIPVRMDSPLRSLSYLFFLSFVFLIVVVLMNLLNGLAVSDTGLIQARAEIVSYTAQVESISYTESVLLGDPFNFLSNWPAFHWLKSIPSLSFCSQLYRNHIIQAIFHKITGATGILLFYSFLPDKTLTCKPNIRPSGCGHCLEIGVMEESILLSAKSVIMRQLAAKAASSPQADRIGQLELAVKLQSQQINQLVEEVRSFLTKGS